jgi:hypothetical protein
MSKLALGLLVAIAFADSLPAQQSESDRKWNQPLKPFRVVANIYYVGASEVTSYLIAGNAGHFLLDAGFVETAPQIDPEGYQRYLNESERAFHEQLDREKREASGVK